MGWAKAAIILSVSDLAMAAMLYPLGLHRERLVIVQALLIALIWLTVLARMLTLRRRTRR